ncbi:MAG: DUF420 domain-containing protein [Candidatus Heimdallarchaeota archaeon]|nr:DUF420 domain-containing protein [Candidatus Heimdallarchaeota archaeon]MDH5646945.1 DUF420 domain-containing protein [Candidatus Heimdallarchaeota archaeon]
MHINTASTLAVTGFFTIALGLTVLLIAFRMAKIRNFKNHRLLMLLAAVINAIFLVQYIIRFSLGQETEFIGSSNIKYFVYYPTLVIHIFTAIISIILIIKHLTSSLKFEKTTTNNIPYFDKEYRDKHKSFGKITFLSWLISYCGGIIIFILLYLAF